MLQDTPPLQSRQSPQPKWLTLFRIILGLILIWKGFSFFKDSASLEEMIRGGGIEMFSNNTRAVAFIITYVNLLGGVFIATGLFTRWMALLNIPVIVGAIIFVNSKAGMSFSNTELILSVAVLILLVVFVVKGSGAISADEFFRSYTKAGMETGHTKKLFQ
jgi:uncharacterized membrane protein YphA (DoxX/SURF4 family)